MDCDKANVPLDILFVFMLPSSWVEVDEDVDVDEEEEEDEEEVEFFFSIVFRFRLPPFDVGVIPIDARTKSFSSVDLLETGTFLELLVRLFFWAGKLEL